MLMGEYFNLSTNIKIGSVWGKFKFLLQVRSGGKLSNGPPRVFIFNLITGRKHYSGYDLVFIGLAKKSVTFFSVKTRHICHFHQ